MPCSRPRVSRNSSNRLCVRATKWARKGGNGVRSVHLVLLQNPSATTFTPSNHPPRKSKRPMGEKVSLPIWPFPRAVDSIPKTGGFAAEPPFDRSSSGPEERRIDGFLPWHRVVSLTRFPLFGSSGDKRRSPGARDAAAAHGIRSFVGLLLVQMSKDIWSRRAVTKACISGLFGARFQNLRMPCAAAA